MHALDALEHWDALDGAQQHLLARQVAEQLPAGFCFVAVQSFRFGAQRHSIALFDFDGARFALISGGQATLGYDPAQPFLPDAEQLASWKSFASRWLHEPDYDLNRYLQQFLTPPRQVTLKPFLLEVAATALEAAVAGPGVVGPGLAAGVVGPGSGLVGPASAVEYSAPPTYRETVDRIAADGFRLPTSDEWEYACAAGARTLWRWGDRCPPIAIPAPSDTARVWDVHLQPNAFGLLIARWPCDWEFCATLGRMRGGDGGTARSGGAGHFIEWLTLASAFEAPWDEDEDAPVYSGNLRRAVSLT
jgi:hypothetical protein